MALCFQFAPEEFIVHEGWKNVHPYQDDIALIRLNRAVVLTESVKPICLPTDERKAAEALEIQSLNGNLDQIEKVRVIGWGFTRPLQGLREQVVFSPCA